MKRKLLQQIANEWRSNVWLVVELIIVSVVVWFIVDYLTMWTLVENEPRGFNVENTFRASRGRLKPQAEGYVDYGEDAAVRNHDDFIAIIRAIRNMPEVEAVSLSMAAEVYRTDYYGNTVTFPDDTMSINMNHGFVTPDHFKVMGFTATDPAFDADRLGDMMRDDHNLVFVTDFSSPNRNISKHEGPVSAADVAGRRIFIYDDSVTPTRFAPVIINPVRMSDLSPLGDDIRLFKYLDETDRRMISQPISINILVRPGEREGFIEKFKALSPTQFRRGNTYISDIQSYAQLRVRSMVRDMRQRNKYVACMVFMLASVFLGLFGTFWFRTQQRVGEIAIRKVNGATNVTVFRRLVSEGWVLLVAATPVAVVADWALAHYEFNANYGGYLVWPRFLATVVIAFVLMALIILAGTVFPAYRASKVDPAQALKDE